VWWALIIFALMVEFFEKFVNNIKKTILLTSLILLTNF